MSTRHPRPGDSFPEFPALRSFLRGYLHQDMKDEYGSAEEALREFCADADPDELQALTQDWSRFTEHYKNQQLQALNAALTGPLGSSYSLTSEEVQNFSAILKEATHKK